MTRAYLKVISKEEDAKEKNSGMDDLMNNSSDNLFQEKLTENECDRRRMKVEDLSSAVKWYAKDSFCYYCNSLCKRLDRHLINNIPMKNK